MSSAMGSCSEDPGTAVSRREGLETRPGCWGPYFTRRPVLCHPIPGTVGHLWIHNEWPQEDAQYSRQRRAGGEGMGRGLPGTHLAF